MPCMISGIFLTFLSENEEINFYVGAQPLKESRDLPDCVKEAYDHICLLDRIGAKRGSVPLITDF